MELDLTSSSLITQIVAGITLAVMVALVSLLSGEGIKRTVKRRKTQRETIEQASAGVLSLESRIDSLQDIIEQQAKERTDLQAKLLMLEAEQHAERERHEEAVTGLHGEVSSLKKELVEKTSQLEGALATLQRQVDENDALKKQLETLGKEIKTLKADYKRLEHEAIEYRAKHEGALDIMKVFAETLSLKLAENGKEKHDEPTESGEGIKSERPAK